MWHLDWELEQHFEIVKTKRAAKYSSPEEEDEEGFENDNPNSNSMWDENVFANRFRE